jgi:hypothetical protein
LDHVEAEALRGVQTTAHRQDEAAVPGEFAATADRGPTVASSRPACNGRAGAPDRILTASR